MIAPDQFKAALKCLSDHGTPASDRDLTAIGIEADTTGIVLFRLQADRTISQESHPWSPELERRAFVSEAPETIGTRQIDSLSRRQEGRTWFILSTASRSVYVYSINLALAFPHIDGQTVAGLSLLSLGAATTASYLFTRDRELGHGRVALMNYGSELGIAYPVLIDNMIGDAPDNDYYYQHTTDPDYTVQAWGTMLGFPLGIYLASRYPLKDPHNYGHVAACRHFSRSAWIYGFMVPIYFNLEDIDDHTRFASVLTMGLLPGGYYLGERLFKDKDLSPGRGHMIEVAGTYGALTGALLFTTLGVKYEFYEDGIAFARWMVTSTLAGHALGTLYGMKYDPDFRPTMGQAIFMDITGVSGAAVGLGLSLLTDLDFSNGTVLTLLSSWAGYAVGERISRNVFEKTDRDVHSSGIHIDSPLLSQWPLLALTSLYQKSATPAHTNPPALDFIRVKF